MTPGLRAVTRTMRAWLTSPVLKMGVLASILPTLVLMPLQAEVILLHSHCDGGTHVHPLEAAERPGWQVRHTEEDSCCNSGEAGVTDATASAPTADCPHNQWPILIAKGAFVATRPAHFSYSRSQVKAVTHAIPAAFLDEGNAGAWVRARSVDTTGPARATGDAIATILSRNHALLF